MVKQTWIPFISTALVIIISSFAPAAKNKEVDLNPYQLKNGDIVFQEGFSAQAIAVKAATNSRWTHVGIVFLDGNNPYIVEAIQPVKVTTLQKFISRNPSSFYAMRLKNRDSTLTKEMLQQAHLYCSAQLGKNYDAKFLWSDDKIYCSELVWKAYKRAAGIELCKTREFRDYNLKHPTVLKIIKQRYRSINSLPLYEPIVAPSDLATSGLLEEVPKK